MRLHQLRATAFGPFAETVEVDFDALSDAGLFLLTGRTGSGKTSVLDAVAFALYGDVPGDRSDAKRFRCDTAAPGVAPRVVLEATLSGRRFRISRSPSWTRPKKRGTGTTTEQASVLLEERIADEWHPLSSRLDETGHLVTGLVGMTMAQFCQVAMLPQGRFQAFLRARSEDRHKLLQQLFSTQRFEDVERWLREHTRELHRSSQRHQRTVSGVISRLVEAIGADVPDWAEDATAVAESGELAAWAEQYERDAVAAAERCADEVRRETDVEVAARAAREAGHGLADLQRRHREAAAELATLELRADEQRARRERVVRAHRAAPVVPLHTLATSSAQQHDRLREQATTATARVAEEAGLLAVDDAELARLEDEARALAADARALQPRAAEGATLAAGLDESATTLVDLRTRRAELDAEIRELPERITDLGTRLSAAREAGTRAAGLDERLERLEAGLAAHERRLAVEADLEQARADLRSAVDTCQSLKEAWLELYEARIRGMAAELATDLAVGASCPVCGSHDHPHKAESAPGAPSAASEKAARKALDDAEVVRTALDGKVRDLATTAATLVGEAGDLSAAELAQQRDTTTSELIRCREAAREVGSLAAALQLAERSLQRARDRHAELGVELATLESRRDTDRERLERIQREVDTLVDGHEHASLTELLESSVARAEDLAGIRNLLVRTGAAEGAATEADSALAGWLAEHDFEHVDAALSAVLPPAEVTSLEEAVAQHEERLGVVRSVLAEPGVREAADRAAPDLAALEAELDRAASVLAAVRTRGEVAAKRAARTAVLRGELEQALDAWAPVRAAYLVSAELAAFLEGKSPDNELRMRLSAYVLAWRLTQVVQAANERLAGMSDQRYTLEHTGRRGAGETRGGLSLLVRDEWSGETRDPATLSGGETFVVSLALALGLADVVTQEAGGADLDTLFVDEGFGSLDAETLDDVMGILDTLRDGGRVIGVVSHVVEMRSRIPVQLAVTKDRVGSTVAVTRGSC